MAIRKVGMVADQLQRAQAYWAVLPEWLRKALINGIWPALVIAATWVYGRVTAAPPFHVFVGMVLTGCGSVVAYSLLAIARSSRNGGKATPHAPAPDVTVEPHGDDVAALVVRNIGGTAKFTGEGEFVAGKCRMPIKRSRPFRVMWDQPSGHKTDFDNIGSGDFGTIVLAEATFGGHRAHVSVFGDGDHVDGWNLDGFGSVGLRPSTDFRDLEVIQIRVTLKAKPPLRHQCSKVFDIVWSGTEKRFHVVEARE